MRDATMGDGILAGSRVKSALGIVGDIWSQEERGRGICSISKRLFLC